MVPFTRHGRPMRFADLPRDIAAPALVGIFAVIVTVACDLPNITVPTGEAEILGCYRVPGAVPAAFDVPVLVTNTGSVTITASHVTVALSSSRREYIRSVHESVGVVPGGALALSLVFEFLGEEEELAEDAAPELVNVYFE